MKVKYIGGKLRTPKGVINNGDVLEWEGDLLMGMTPIPGSPTSEKPRWKKPETELVEDPKEDS